jgi:hypothetical protein
MPARLDQKLSRGEGIIKIYSISWEEEFDYFHHGHPLRGTNKMPAYPI